MRDCSNSILSALELQQSGAKLWTQLALDNNNNNHKTITKTTNTNDTTTTNNNNNNTNPNKNDDNIFPFQFGELVSGDYDSILGRPPPHPGGTDADTFEESLHMSSDRPPSRQLSAPYTPTHNGHRTSDSDISDAYDYCQPRRRSLSESGGVLPYKPQPKKRVTYLSTPGISHGSSEGQGQVYDPTGQLQRYDSEGQRYDSMEGSSITDAPTEEGPVSFDMPTYRPNMQIDNRYNSSPVVRMSPQRCSPESPPSARKWGSEAGREGFGAEGSQGQLQIKRTFDSRKCVWKCHLQKGIHFVS